MLYTENAEFQGYTTDMTLEQQIGQLLVAGFEGLTPSPEIIHLIEQYHIGNIILFSRNIGDAQQVLALTHSLQEIARKAGHRVPLMISIDQENGIVNRLGSSGTAFPGNMALGATNSEELVYDIAWATGRELKALGINMNLAPVVDVNNNPLNPVIGVRSFGEDPELVARLGAASVRGHRAAGVMCCLKHFPGHGNTAVDSHLALPTISATMEELEAVELLPFKRGIEAGAECVMVAHINFPELMPDTTLPATVSPALARNLLREKMGFEGVIVSDCMEMSAITSTVGSEQGALMALQSGFDLVFISHTHTRVQGAIQAIHAALAAGELTEEAIRQAAERVLRLKHSYLSWENLPSATVSSRVGGKDNRQLSSLAYECSTTLLRNEDALIPLRFKANEELLVVYPRSQSITMVEDDHSLQDFLPRSIRLRHPDTIALPISVMPTQEECEAVMQTASRASMIIMATMNANIYEGQARLMQQLMQTGKHVIGIAVRNPYDIQAFPDIRTYLLTYEYTEPALEAAIQVLFGETLPLGHLPVTLPLADVP